MLFFWAVALESPAGPNLPAPAGLVQRNSQQSPVFRFPALQLRASLFPPAALCCAGIPELALPPPRCDPRSSSQSRRSAGLAGIQRQVWRRCPPRGLTCRYSCPTRNFLHCHAGACMPSCASTARSRFLSRSSLRYRILEILLHIGHHPCMQMFFRCAHVGAEFAMPHRFLQS